MEACAVRLNVEGKFIDIFGLCRSPSAQVSDLKEFVSDDSKHILKMTTDKHHFIWMGDLNIDMLCHSKATEE